MRKSIFLAHIHETVQQRGGTLKEWLVKVKQLGFEGLECDYADLERDPKAFAAMLAEVGLEIASVPYFFFFERGVDPQKIRTVVCNVAAAGGKKLLAIPGELDGTCPNALDRMVEGLTILCKEAEQAGITVSLEDFGDIKSPCCSMEGLKYFFDRVPGLKFNMDTGNFLCMGADLLDSSCPFMDRLAHIHLKDWCLAPLYADQAYLEATDGAKLYSSPVGGGVIPMEQALAMAEAAGYDGFCSAEHYGVADQWDFVVKSAAWMADHM